MRNTVIPPAELLLDIFGEFAISDSWRAVGEEIYIRGRDGFLHLRGAEIR